MPKKAGSIPVNNFGGECHPDISIEKIALKDLPDIDGAGRSERHDRHTFHLLEKGIITIEIDLQQYEMRAPSILYMHPDQVHRLIAFKNVSVYTWALNNADLDIEYLKLLEDITPAMPLRPKKNAFSILSEAVSLCMKFVELKDNKLYHSLLKNCCNALVGLVVEAYLELSKPVNRPQRWEVVTKELKEKKTPHSSTMCRISFFSANNCFNCFLF